MSLEVKDFVGIALSGASFGIITSGLSAISNGVFNAPLGFCPFNIKNVFKVGILSSGTFVVIMGVLDWIKDYQRQDA